MKLDLHVHSMFSYDSGSSPRMILDKLRRLGLDGAVITEHNSYAASAEWDKEKAGDRVILRGAEYNTREGHLLIYGIDSDEYIAVTHKPLVEMIRIAEGEGWVLAAAHPFKGAATDLGSAVYEIPGLHAIELNSYCSDEENQEAIEAAQELGLTLIGGSDAHVDSRVGRFHTIFDKAIGNIEQLKAEIQNGRCHTARLLPDETGRFCIPEILI